MMDAIDGLSLRERYGHLFGRLSGLSRAPARVNESNVYQEGNPAIRKLMDAMLEENLLPGSHLEGREHFAEFLEQVRAGKRGLLLSEHYSNLDLPTIFYLLEHDKGNFGKEIAARLVAISGLKLNEDSPFVRAYTEAFTRIVIYPSRSLAKVTDSEEINRGKKINMAAMRAMDTARLNKQIITVFPSGTRYRPGKPETKRGVREIDSYLRIFEVMILVSINGSCLRLCPDNTEDMLADLVFRDKVIVASSPVMECKPFRKAIIDGIDPASDVDPKQVTSDRIMELLEEQHIKYEAVKTMA
ncbi:MAG: 1-acyl-sn-glycerol-3-phosphate acyltransferase [Spirochaetaceae bacterium]|jgi:glycerol-3-phosphate O-acyltransferase|nr:1-acyl-sn-glycerol-3-phosphate acyltransferase [Spirochaetaceae bacterium]